MSFFLTQDIAIDLERQTPLLFIMIKLGGRTLHVALDRRTDQLIAIGSKPNKCTEGHMNIARCAVARWCYCRLYAAELMIWTGKNDTETRYFFVRLKMVVPYLRSTEEMCRATIGTCRRMRCLYADEPMAAAIGIGLDEVLRVI